VYLQLVENEREGNRVRQRLVASLGRLDELRASGQLERLTESLARLTEELEAVCLARDLEARSARSVGGILVLERLWSELGLDGLMRRVETVAWPDKSMPELHHLYRSLDVLADAKEDLELRLHHRVRDLFHQRLDLVLYDNTTSLYFESPLEDGLRRRGHSKDKRPDLPQAVLERLKDRVGLRWCIFVGDRGMVSEKNLEALEVKEVRFDGIRYVVCRNAEQARRDAARRAAVLERLASRLDRSGVKGLLTRRYTVPRGTTHSAGWLVTAAIRSKCSS